MAKISNVRELIDRVKTVAKENEANKMLKSGWVLLNTGNRSVVTKYKNGMAIGQSPYFVLGHLRGH